MILRQRLLNRFAPTWVLIGLCLLVGLCLPISGCTSQKLVKLRSRPHNPLANRLKLYARGGPKSSERTRQLLRQNDLAGRWVHNPRQLVTSLGKIHQREPRPESCYALAELSYIAAKKLELNHRREAQKMYWDCVVQSYAYLFDPQYNAVRNPYDPQFRGACDLYNSALESCLRIARKQGHFKPGRKISFTINGRKLDVSVESKGFNWRAEDFDRFEFVSDYKVTGLTNQYHTFGLGVPLIAIRRSDTGSPEIEQYYARGLSFPVTAFLRLDFESSSGEHHTGAVDVSTCHLELHDPMQATGIAVAGSQIPLESDISTPLAFFLDQSAIKGLDHLGLFRPNEVQKIAGLYMVQPYQPGKIPVLMIHGLWSSPMTWMEAFNDLQSMPEIQERYQFWFYLYPSGNPFWESAADIREHLAEIRTVFGPHERTQVLDQMVLVGHSMGGLIARLQTVESGNDYWNSVSDQPFELLNATHETKQRFERLYFFEPDRSVSRVITIGSPHRGSYFSNLLTRWLIKPFITLPEKTFQSTVQLISRNPGVFRGLESLTYQTGVDSISPESPILLVLLETLKPTMVKYHNVVGLTKNGLLEENTDGVVPYSSAHLDDVESEIFVKAHHTQLHRHPATVLEIRRILLQHLEELPAHRRSEIIQLGGSGHSPHPHFFHFLPLKPFLHSMGDGVPSHKRSTSTGHSAP